MISNHQYQTQITRSNDPSQVAAYTIMQFAMDFCKISNTTLSILSSHLPYTFKLKPGEYKGLTNIIDPTTDIKCKYGSNGFSRCSLVLDRTEFAVSDV